MNYKDMLIEKTKIRLTDPLRYDVITMILDGASKKAKTAQREVTEEDLLAAVRSEVKSMEKAIELIESKKGDASRQKAELEVYESYLPRYLDTLATTVAIVHLIDTTPELTPEKKNMGRYITKVKALPNASQFDMGIVSKTLQSLLQ